MEAVPNQAIQLLNEHAVAKLLDVSVATVRRWRLLGKGLPLSGSARHRYDIGRKTWKAYLEQCPAFGESAKRAR